MSYFKILTDDAVKVVLSICQQIWKTQQWPQDYKKSVFIPIPKKANAKECSNYQIIMLISHASKVILQILQQYVSQELPGLQAELQKRQRNQRSNCQHLLDHRKKQENSRKTSTSASLTTLKPLTMWITTNCGKFLKRRGHQTTLPASGEICKQVKKQQLELNMEQRNGSKLDKDYFKAIYCHLLI